MTNVRAGIFVRILPQSKNSQYIFFVLLPIRMSLYIDMKKIRAVNCSSSPCILSIIFWISARTCNVVSPLNMFHSNSVGSPSIRSSSPYWGVSVNHSIFFFHAPMDSGYWCILPRHNTESGNTKTFAVDNWTALSVNKVVLCQEYVCTNQFLIFLEFLSELWFTSVTRRRIALSFDAPDFW